MLWQPGARLMHPLRDKFAQTSMLMYTYHNKLVYTSSNKSAFTPKFITILQFGWNCLHSCTHSFNPIDIKLALNMKFASCFVIVFVVQRWFLFHKSVKVTLTRIIDFSMPSADGFSILLLQTPYAPTHVKLLFSLVKELVNRGHWVTTVRW